MKQWDNKAEAEKAFKKVSAEITESCKDKKCPVMGGANCITSKCMCWDNGMAYKFLSSYRVKKPSCNSPLVSGFICIDE